LDHGKKRSINKNIQNWLSDLLNTMDEVLDDETKTKLMAGCGKGCYNRFKFKRDIGAYGHRDMKKLIEAFKNNFEKSLEMV